MEQFKRKYFLGANSCEGFVSAFGNSYRPDGEWRAVLIKGGPGTGKSSFMKYVALKAAERGMEPVLCPCSSDPGSLDAVILPEKHFVIMDSTAPHTVDPSYPGACETIVNLGVYWSQEKLLSASREIIDATNRNHALHQSASRYLRAAGLLLTDNYKTALACTDQEKTLAFADRLCRQWIPESPGQGTEWVRFAGGITPLGVVSYAGSITAETEKIVVIDDVFGSASHLIMKRIREYALQNGQEVLTLKNPFLPSQILDHVVLPSLSLAFVTENDFIRFTGGGRRIHARRFVSAKQLHASRERMRFNRKAVRELLVTAAGKLAQAKAVHDELEQYYIHAMDFESLTAFATEFTEKLLDTLS
ncbi:MAG: hypothetical protein IJT66_02890 [Clostridia bacterium]|nr:hypothetical protein [Clostridia bacterium]